MHTRRRALPLRPDAMDARDARDARDEPLAINLKVLSPSSEIEGGLHLRDLAASTTVRELRLRIQDAVPSRPGPERMRLIYRGKVVANDADSLEAVFGADNVRAPLSRRPPPTAHR